jgi:hypothetical protein
VLRESATPEDDFMPHYRLYFLRNPSGSIERHEQFEARDDDDALEIIDHYVGDKPLELWTGGRKVGQFETALGLSGLTAAGLWCEPEPTPLEPSRRLFQF